MSYTLLTRPRHILLLCIALLALAGCNQDSTGTAHRLDPGITSTSSPSYWPTTDWQTDTPEHHGFPAGALSTLDADIATALPYYTSLLVIKDGWLVHESYHTSSNGEASDINTKHHVWSITKSVTSMTVGRAWTRGDLTSLDVRAGDIFPPTAFGSGIASNDARRDISLRDTLQMRSGLAWNENAWLVNTSIPVTKDPLLKALGFGGPDPDCTNGDILCSVMHQPEAYPHGTVWNYNTYDPYLTSAFFTGITHSTLNAYANQYLFSPLGITSFDPANDWPDLSSGNTFGGGLLFIRSRDLAKLGMLIQYDGRWDGQQLLSSDWLNTSLTEQGPGFAAAFDTTTDNPIAAVAQNIYYGMLWWTKTGNMVGPTSITARGLGGQMMHIFKSKGLIILITCDSSFTYDRAPEINAFLQTNILNKLP
jgi:CubicO group peptidase (beta-lactamase class C family)